MKIAVIPDTHFPFEDEKKLAICINTISQISVDAIIQVGDLRDQLAFSKYAKNPSKMKYSPA
jgi:predicted phosphodiesterase